jgi:hypothetical protein
MDYVEDLVESDSDNADPELTPPFIVRPRRYPCYFKHSEHHRGVYVLAFVGRIITLRGGRERGVSLLPRATDCHRKNEGVLLHQPEPVLQRKP